MTTATDRAWPDAGRHIRVRPFHCGSQYRDWRADNCDQCVRGRRDASGMVPWGQCEIADALTLAALDDGTVAGEVACRMGFHDHNGPQGFAYTWPCTEWVDIPAGFQRAMGQQDLPGTDERQRSLPAAGGGVTDAA